MTVVGATSGAGAHTADRTAYGRERALLALFLAVQAVAWVVVPVTTMYAPHANTIELALWGRDWFIVNFKHPALPAWLLAIAYRLFGVHLWVSFALAEACIALAYVFVFLLGRDLLGARAALFGTLLLPAVHHFTLEALRYNHNVVQLPLWIGFCFGLWRAARSDRILWWVLAAALAALGFYAKLTMAMAVAFGALWLVIDPEARSRLRGKAPYAGLLVFLALMAPLTMAFVASRFQALGWIAQESADRGTSTPHFLHSVGKTLLVMVVFAGIGMLAARIAPRREPVVRTAATVAPRALFFLAFMGAGPLLLMTAIAVAEPVMVEWAAPMYSMLGPLLVALVIRNVPRAAAWVQAGRRHAVLALVGSLYVIGAYAAEAAHDRAHGNTAKQDWPAAEMAARFDAVWSAATGRPLRIVGGDTWVAALAGWMSAGHPSLFVDLDQAKSPAITDARLRADGVLVLWLDNSSWRPDSALVARLPHGSESFAFPSAPNVPPVVVDYAIVAPGQWNR
jgi:4-amino-4-deoxy-L-arabinose transferase-like glycosyltransferase